MPEASYSPCRFGRERRTARSSRRAEAGACRESALPVGRRGNSLARPSRERRVPVSENVDCTASVRRIFAAPPLPSGAPGRLSPNPGRGIRDESRGGVRVKRVRELLPANPARGFSDPGFAGISARRRNALSNSSLASNPSGRGLLWARASRRCGESRALLEPSVAKLESPGPVRAGRQRALEVGPGRSRLSQPNGRGRSARTGSRKRARGSIDSGWLMRRARRHESYRSWREPTPPPLALRSREREFSGRGRNPRRYRDAAAAAKSPAAGLVTC